MDTKKQYRPPVNQERKAMLERMAKKFNETALIPVTPHNMLDAAIDRAFSAMFPDVKKLPKRKKFVRIDY